jgi:hypothetical protein
MPHLTPDTQPIPREGLLPEQRTVLDNLCKLLRQIADETTRPSGDGKGTCAKSPWTPRLQYDRTHRVILIEGARGTGKTSLMLTFLAATRAQTQDLDHDPADKAYADLVPRDPLWRCVPQIDFDPLPEHVHAFAFLVHALHGLANYLEPDDDAPYERSKPGGTMRAWCDLYKQALVGWNADYDRQAMNRDIEQYVYEQRERLADWKDLAQAWRRFVDRLLKELNRTSDRTLPDRGLLVVPIDDLDLHPHRAHELLQALRLCWHPRVVFLLTGHKRHLRDAIADHIAGQARRRAGTSWQDAGEENRWSESRVLARALVEKSLPAGHVLHAPMFSMRDFLSRNNGTLPEAWRSIDTFLAAWKAIGGSRADLVRHVLGDDMPKGSFGFAIRDMIEAAGDLNTDLATALGCLLERLRDRNGGYVHLDGDEVDEDDTKAAFKVFAIPKDLRETPGWQQTTEVQFLFSYHGRFVGVAPAEVVLDAEYVASGAIAPGNIAWDASLPVSSVLARVDLPSGALFMPWPEPKGAKQPSDALAMAAKTKTAARRFYDRAHGFGMAAVTLITEHPGIPPWALRIDPRTEREYLEGVLWFASPESGVADDDRHLILYGAGLRLGLSHALQRAEGELTALRTGRLAAAQKLGRLTPQLRGEVWPTLALQDLEREIDVDEQNANGPWGLRDYLLRPDWLDWPLTTPAPDDPAGMITRHIGGILSSITYMRPEKGPRSLIALLSDRRGAQRQPFGPTFDFGRHLCHATTEGRTRLQNWIKAIAAGFPDDSDSQAGAGRLVVLWDAAVESCAAKPPFDLMLREDGASIDVIFLSGDDSTLTVTIDDRPAAHYDDLGARQPGSWHIRHNVQDLGDCPWAVFLFATTMLDREVGQPLTEVRFEDFRLLSGCERNEDDRPAGPRAKRRRPKPNSAGSASFYVPVEKIGWLAAEQIRLRWARFLQSIDVQQGRSIVAVRRWLMANALQFVADSWWSEDGWSQVGFESFPVVPDWFREFASLHVDGRSRRGSAELAEWLGSLDIATLVDEESANAWRSGIRPTAPEAVPPKLEPRP